MSTIFIIVTDEVNGDSSITADKKLLPPPPPPPPSPPPSPSKKGSGATGSGATGAGPSPGATGPSGGSSEPKSRLEIRNIQETMQMGEDDIQKPEKDIQPDVAIPEEKELELTTVELPPNWLFIMMIAAISLAIAIVASLLKREMLFP